MQPWMIYGVTGYVGGMIVEHAAKLGLRPILGGRHLENVKIIADRYGLQYRVFSLENKEKVEGGLIGLHTILLAAGPYPLTYKSVLKACLKLKVNYVDLNVGDHNILIDIQRHGKEAEKAGIILMPGAGYASLASDCVALNLKQSMPDADQLDLIYPSFSPSPGTLKAAILRRNKTLAVLREGQVQELSPSSFQEEIFDIPDNGVMTIFPRSWGDIIISHLSTKIPNITVKFQRGPRLLFGLVSLEKTMNSLARYRWGKKILIYLIDSFMRPPHHQNKIEGRCHIYGQVKNKYGRILVADLETEGIYKYTAEAALATTLSLMNSTLQPGFNTPLTAFGDQLALNINKTKLMIYEGEREMVEKSHDGSQILPRSNAIHP